MVKWKDICGCKWKCLPNETNITKYTIQCKTSGVRDQGQERVYFREHVYQTWKHYVVLTKTYTDVIVFDLLP